MRINTFSSHILTIAGGLFMASSCAKQPPVTTAPPVSSPQPQSEPVVATSTQIPRTVKGPWTFQYAPGNVTYTVTTDAQIALLSDSTHPRIFPESIQRVTLAVGSVGEVQLIDPPLPTSSFCDSVASLATRALQLIPKVPPQLSVGFTWSDSAYVEGCRGNIPASTNFVHTYTVIGDTVFNGTTALYLVRSDLITSRGEGNEGQHRILFTASGTGKYDMFFDITGGRMLGTTGTQSMSLDITTSGRMNHFLQRVTERTILSPAP